MSRRTVVIGNLGTKLDAGLREKRWDKWRPSIGICQQPDLHVDRVELLYQSSSESLARQIAADIPRASPGTEVRTTRIEIANAWDFEAVYGALHDFARAYAFDPEHEDYLVHITTGTHVMQICLFLLAEARYIPGRLLQSSPPRLDPGVERKHARAGETSARHAGSHDIIDLDLSRYDRIAARFRTERRDAVTLLKSGIATRNAAYNRLIAKIEQVALASRAPILLMGPTGAGKSQLARRIFELKQARRLVTGTMVEVNCATLRGDAAMSTLFGHVKGAFTGAQVDRAGLLKKAHGGVMFLDEIGELGLDEQAMLLRAIEEKTFLPMGSDREAQSDFQLVVGTNRDLATEVAARRFREDLLTRIELWTFRLPALAERTEDIEPNLAYELERASLSLGSNATMNRDARERYLAFATSPTATWAGNFRDLSASVTRMATLAPGGRIDVATVNEEVTRLTSQWAARSRASGGAERGGGEDESVETVLGAEALAELDPFDRAQLVEVIRVCRSARSLSDAGRVLFAQSRKRRGSVNDADRLRKYLARYGCTFDEVQKSR